ncbi:hypothetical protein HYS94_02065 [Candidatus Daviesbacteria bacterium]|nr:hypothetical protein [Candidatus Daviesbacteria bacterium]
MLEKIWKDGVALSVDVRLWGGDAALDPEDVGLSSVDVPQDLFQMGRKRLVPKLSMSNLVAYRMKTRNVLFRYSFPMPFGDTWFVPWTNVKEVVDWLKETQSQFYKDTDKFLSEYDTLRESFLAEHEQYRKVLEPFYPSQKRLSNKFYFKYSLFELSVPRTGVLSAEDAQRVDQETDNFLKQVTTQLRQQAGDAASKLAATLEKDSATKASLKSAQNMVERFKSLNFVKDTKMENALNLLNAALSVGLDNPELVEAAKGVVVEARVNGNTVNEIVGSYKRALDLS